VGNNGEERRTAGRFTGQRSLWCVHPGGEKSEVQQDEEEIL